MPDLQRDVVSIHVRVILLLVLVTSIYATASHDQQRKGCKVYYRDEQYSIAHRSQPPLMTWGKTGEWPSEMSALKW